MAAAYHNLDIADLTAVLMEILPAPVADASDDVPLDESLGRIPPKTVSAPHDLPSLPVSTVDGFCLGPKHGSDYRVVSQSVPGGAVPPSPKPGQAVFVMTGGPLPENADGVVPREQVSGDGQRIRVHDEKAVRPMAAGARIRSGSALVREGRIIGPAQVAALAEYGIRRVAVTPKPVVALLAVGSEFGHTDHTGDSSHHNGNGPHLAALVSLCGGQPFPMPPAADDRGVIAEALKRCTAPLVITTGGTAKGRFDLTAQAVADAGFRWAIDGLNLRPGQTTRVATRGDQVLVSLPGSPGAIAPLFCLLIRPILARRCGDRMPPTPVCGRLATVFTRYRPAPLLSAAKVSVDDTGCVRITPERGATDGYVRLPKGDGPLAIGTVLPLYSAPGPAVGIIVRGNMAQTG